MSKARAIIQIMDEVNGIVAQVPANAVAVTSTDQLKPGLQVFFKADHPKYPAMGPAVVINLHPELDSVDLKYGHATFVNVPITDLMLTGSPVTADSTSLASDEPIASLV